MNWSKRGANSGAVPLERYARLLADLRASGGSSLSVLLVIVREMALLERA